MPRGRPPKVDPDTVLDTAADMFRRDGFEAVSVAAVCKRAGLPVQSVYNRFGDKAGLFRAALDRYGRTANDPQIESLAQADDALAALRGFVDQLKRHRGASVEDGCLFTQVMASGDRSRDTAPDATARAFTLRLRKTLTATVRRATEAGQLRSGTADAVLADALLTTAFGIAVIGRGGMPASMIDHAVTAAHRLLDEASV